MLNESLLVIDTSITSVEKVQKLVLLIEIPLFNIHFLNIADENFLTIFKSSFFVFFFSKLIIDRLAFK